MSIRRYMGSNANVFKKHLRSIKSTKIVSVIRISIALAVLCRIIYFNLLSGDSLILLLSK